MPAAPTLDADPESPAATQPEAASLGAGSGAMAPPAAALVLSASVSLLHRNVTPSAGETVQVPTAAAPCAFVTLAQV
jgi:hypothetical protein